MRRPGSDRPVCLQDEGSSIVKLLIVEDSPEIAARIQRVLAADAGLEVVGTAASNAQAIALFERFRPDVVSLDVRLDDGSSMRSLRRMMAADPPPAVIIVTDHILDPYRQRYLAAGAVHVMAKSDLAALPALIRSIAPSL
jgi:two-component system, chemotaxis family, protein-glutamate methylesterase/glutaminase